MSRSLLFALAVVLLAGCSPADAPAGSGSCDGSRIVSLAPALTETLFALGLGENVVGVSSFCKYPPEVKDISKVGGFLDTDFEAIVRLRPTCVVITCSEADTGQRLRNHGLKVLEVPLTTFSDIKGSFAFIGHSLGRSTEAMAVEKEFLSAMEMTESGRRPSAVFVIWRDYGNGAVREVQAAGGESMYGDLAAAAGFRLLPEESSMKYPQLSAESLLRMQPEYIFEFIPGCSSTERIIDEWRKSLPGLDAVKNNRVFVVDEDFAVIPGPRFTKVCGLLRDRAGMVRDIKDKNVK